MSKPINGRPALSDEVKKRLKPLIIELRRTLEEDLERELRRLGLDRSKDSPLPVEALSYLTEQEREIRAELEAILAKEQESIGSFAGALEAVRREAAYTHLNRLVGLKCLELRSHLVIEGERTEAVTCRQEFGGRSKWLWTLRSRESRYRHGAQAEELLWREGLLQACAAVTQEIGVLFDPADPYAKVWPSFRTLRAVVDRLNELPEDAFRTDELLGWVYQYFQTEEKEKVTAGESFTQKLKKTKKITGADIATYTALYTERYMVDFLLQNSIGAYWMEMYPDSRAKEAWQYYVTPATPHTRLPKPLKEWKLLDPAMGSGHFLVVAFDLLAQLYEEERQMEAQGRLPRGWSVPAGQTARVILENNLHGIDIDLRAAQLAALALYLKAKELGWDEAGGPPRLNLVVADAVLTRGEAYERLLAQYKDNPAIQEAIRSIWYALENVRELGSLVRVEEEVDKAIRIARVNDNKQTPLFASVRDWFQYKNTLYQRLHEVYEIEGGKSDTNVRIFGSEIQKSLTLLKILSNRYDTVFTNPPYMGSKQMEGVLKRFVDQHYKAGKRDLYSAFILRCLELAVDDGRVAMVTQQSWMFLKTFENFRALPKEKLDKKKPDQFDGILRTVSIESLAHMGANAFSEISGEIVNVVLFTFRNQKPSDNHRLVAYRLIGGSSADQKKAMLLSAISSNNGYKVVQKRFLNIESSPLSYWLTDRLLDFMGQERRLSTIAHAGGGVGTRDENRFLRKFWEVPSYIDWWKPYAKGGKYQKWVGLLDNVIDWENDGERVKNSIIRKYPYLKGNYGFLIRDEKYHFKPGLTYTDFAQGNFSCRLLDSALFSDAGPGIFIRKGHREGIMAWLNTHLVSFMLRAISPLVNHFGWGYVLSLPIPDVDVLENISSFAQIASEYKVKLIEKVITDRNFRYVPAEFLNPGITLHKLEVILHSLEGFIEHQLSKSIGIGDEEVEALKSEVGTPVGWFPLIKGYTELPRLEDNYPDVPEAVLMYLEGHNHIILSERELYDVKNRLEILYHTGPGVNEANGIDSESGEVIVFENDDEEKESALLGANIPIPTETFLEELSQKLKIHPISVYRLLEEISREKQIICPALMQQNVISFLSEQILRMLGHEWPNQKAYEKRLGKPILPPKWVNPNGILLLTHNSGEENFTERLRNYLDEAFGSDHGLDVERQAIVYLSWRSGDELGQQKAGSLEQWFEREFFKRHVSQFKKRPIAWHLTSPKGAFQAFVYYHKFDKDRLKLLRSRYVSETLKELRRQLGEAQNQAALDRKALNRVAELEEKIADVEEFDRRLGLLQEGRQREARIWVPWKSPAEQPVGWDPDINDGVRVNIAPVQRLGLLAAQVLSKKDLDSLLAPEGR